MIFLFFTSVSGAFYIDKNIVKIIIWNFKLYTRKIGQLDTFYL